MDGSVSSGGEAAYEYIVLGAGPAGLQMGRHLAAAGRRYLILEGGDSPGAFFKKLPRHRRPVSGGKAVAGFADPEAGLRFDWNSLLDDGDGCVRCKDYRHRHSPPAEEMVRYLADYACANGLDVRCDTRIIRVEKPGPERFRLIGARGDVFTCRRLIVATGVGKPYVPAIPGVELAEGYFDVSVDPEDFADQRVLILGKGNPALETAESLAPAAALIHVAGRPVDLAATARSGGRLRTIDSNFLDVERLESRNAVLDCAVERIARRDGRYVVAVRYSDAPGEVEELVYDRVILCAGFRFDGSIFAAECRPRLVVDDRFPAQTAEWESVNVPGLYFAGTLMQANDFKQPSSGFIHGFRYNVRALHRLLEAKHHGRSWPARPVEPTPEGLLEAALARLNRSSALWQPLGSLHDVVIVEEGWDHAAYYEEMPLAYLHSSGIGDKSHYYTIGLELAKAGPEPGRAERSVLLHPVVRRWSGRRLVSEVRLPADPSGEWSQPEAHVAALRCFFIEQLLESVELEKVATAQPQAPRPAPRRAVAKRSGAPEVARAPVAPAV
jgi:thioredoxin reductase